MRGHSIAYSEYELVWIEVRADLPRRELHAQFCVQFDRDDVSLGAFKGLCKRMGWMTGRTGCFEPGAVPANKGKPMPDSVRAKVAATQFKKGARPHTWRGAGHERVDEKDGYVILIVDEPNPWTGAPTRPVQKHRWLWEKANGPIPEGHALKCLSDDKTNCEPSNWELVDRAMMPRLAGRHTLGYDQAPPELKPTILAVAKLEHGARVARQRRAA